jgi:RNA polymerase sigma factor (TIGR02999 family)
LAYTPEFGVFRRSAFMTTSTSGSTTTATQDPVIRSPSGDAHQAVLFTSLYADLCRLARREVWRNGAHDFLGTGTLVHEVWLDFQRSGSKRFDGTGRFLAYAARMLRGLVIDRVRARQALKRGAGLDITALDTQNAEEIEQPEALEHLELQEPDLARVVDLKLFCGFTLAEIATMHNVSERTVQRQWEKARVLLMHALS